MKHCARATPSWHGRRAAQLGLCSWGPLLIPPASAGECRSMPNLRRPGATSDDGVLRSSPPWYRISHIVAGGEGGVRRVRVVREEKDEHPELLRGRATVTWRAVCRSSRGCTRDVTPSPYGRDSGRPTGRQPARRLPGSSSTSRHRPAGVRRASCGVPVLGSASSTATVGSGSARRRDGGSTGQRPPPHMHLWPGRRGGHSLHIQAPESFNLRHQAAETKALGGR